MVVQKNVRKGEVVKFADILNDLKGIKFKVASEGTLHLPFKTTKETIQDIIHICRVRLLTDWHVVYPEPTIKNPEPSVIFYWDRFTKKV
jgi:hypothetical protein